METDNIANRLRKFMESRDLSNSQFADACGIPRPNLSQLLSGRNKKVSDVLIGQIHKAYPELSVMWLLFGEGKMTTATNDNVDACSSESENEGTSDNTPIMQSSCISDMFTNNTDISCDEIRNEDSKNPSISPNQPIESNLNPLKWAPESMQHGVNKEKINIPDTVELLKQIDKMKRNPRKVVQIMVYYDDSTFETFYPNSRK